MSFGVLVTNDFLYYFIFQSFDFKVIPEKNALNF